MWRKQKQFNSFHLTGLYLLANGDEPNLILPKVARPLYFFHQLFGNNPQLIDQSECTH